MHGATQQSSSSEITASQGADATNDAKAAPAWQCCGALTVPLPPTPQSVARFNALLGAVCMIAARPLAALLSLWSSRFRVQRRSERF